MSQIQSITLLPNQIGYIPSNATIVSITGTAIPNSNGCIPLVPSIKKCYKFMWQTTNTVETDFDDAYFPKLIVGNLEFNIPAVNEYEDGGSEGSKLAGALDSVPNKIWTVLAFDQAGMSTTRGVQISIADTGNVPMLKLIQGVGMVDTTLLLLGIECPCSLPPGWSPFVS